MRAILIVTLLWFNNVSAKFKINYISDPKSEPVVSAKRDLKEPEDIVKKPLPIIPSFNDENSLDNLNDYTGVYKNQNETPNSDDIEQKNTVDDSSALPLEPKVFSSKESMTLYATLMEWMGSQATIVFSPEVSWAKNIVLKTPSNFSVDLNDSISQLLNKLNANKKMIKNGIVLAYTFNNNNLEIYRV